MALNIKNAHTERLAHELAQETGETLTQAVTRALEERLARLRGSARSEDLVASIMEISRRCSALPVVDARAADEILGYDEYGAFGS